MDDTDRDMVSGALDLLDWGYSIFPLHGIRPNGKCTCGGTGAGDCQSPGKHPRVKNVPGEASDDHDQVMHWFSVVYPDSNIALRCPVDEFVLDVDPQHGGDRFLSFCETRWGALSNTRRIVTGGGGWHLFFRLPAPEQLPNGKLPGQLYRADGQPSGVDILRHDHRYSVAPPSLHHSGNRYGWASPPKLPAAEAPRWLLGLFVRPRTTNTSSGDDGPWSQKRFDGLHDSLAATVEGERNGKTYWAACKLLEQVAHGTLSDVEAYALLHDAVRRMPAPLGEAEVDQCWNSAQNRNPR